jgi:hypothetical protein
VDLERARALRLPLAVLENLRSIRGEDWMQILELTDVSTDSALAYQRYGSPADVGNAEGVTCISPNFDTATKRSSARCE